MTAAAAAAAADDYLKTGNRAPLIAIIKQMEDVSVLSKPLITTVLSRLSRTLDKAKIADMLGLLYAITVRQGIPIIKNKLGLYIKLLGKYIDDEMVCRNCLGLLFALSSDPAIVKKEVAAGVLPIVLQIMTIHRASLKVHEGCARLLNKIDRESLIKAGIPDAIIDLFVVIINDVPLYDAMDLYAELLFKLTNEGIKRRVADLVLIAANEMTSDKSYIFIDRTLNSVGFTVAGLPVSLERDIKTVEPLKRKKRVYMSMGHSSEIVGDAPLPVPTGCVYVTFAICGEETGDAYKILAAFGDPAIRKMLHDPVRYIKELTTYFGESLHVHYPEAPTEAGRTYYDMRYTPFAGFFRGSCLAIKSGLYLLGHPTSFAAAASTASASPLTKFVGHADLHKFMADIDCHQISKRALQFLYSGALYPDRKQLVADLIRPLTYDLLENEARKFRYTQSWAFSQFPGVHYNFLCRGHKVVRRASLKTRRAAASREAAATLLMSRKTRRSLSRAKLVVA